MRSRKEKIATYIIGVLGVAAFCILTVIALVWANGLQFDPQTKTINQTAVIAIEPKLSNVTVLINGRVVANQTPYQKRNLAGGQYEVVIQRRNFKDYKKLFKLLAGEVGVIKEDAVFLASEPKRTLLTDVTYREHTPIDLGLSVTGGEITDQGKLITRLSQEPIIFRRLNKGYLYQIDRQLRFYLPENLQDELVAELASSAIAKINVDFNDWRVIIFEGEQALSIELTVPAASSVI